MDFSQYKKALSQLSTSNKEILNTATRMSITFPSFEEEEVDETLKFTIVNKNINTPIGMRDVLVQGDKLSRKIFFEMNRYFDGVDLSTKQFFINYINASNQSGVDDIVDLYVTDDKITFEWWVPAEVTVSEGMISVQLEITELDEVGDVAYRYATVPISFEVKKTISPNGMVDSTDYYLDIFFLNQYTEDIYYNMASDTEPIQIENRSIVMPYLEDFLITQDSRSKILTFVINRYVDNVDLSEKTIVIKFELPDGQGDRSFASNIAVSDTKIRFDWLLDSRVTLKEGKVTFAIEFIGYNEKEEFTCWNTLTSSIFVSKGLEVDSKIEPPSTSWIQSWNILADKYLKNFTAYSDKIEKLYAILNDGFLSIKGVTVSNTEQIEGGNRVTFSYVTDDWENPDTTSIDVMNGISIVNVEVREGNKLFVTLSDGTEIYAGEITVKIYSDTDKDDEDIISGWVGDLGDIDPDFDWGSILGGTSSGGDNTGDSGNPDDGSGDEEGGSGSGSGDNTGNDNTGGDNTGGDSGEDGSDTGDTPSGGDSGGSDGSGSGDGDEGSGDIGSGDGDDDGSGDSTGGSESGDSDGEGSDGGDAGSGDGGSDSDEDEEEAISGLRYNKTTKSGDTTFTVDLPNDATLIEYIIYHEDGEYLDFDVEEVPNNKLKVTLMNLDHLTTAKNVVLYIMFDNGDFNMENTLTIEE